MIRPGSAVEINGSSMQLSMHRNNAMLEMFISRSFHEDIAADCCGDSSFLDVGVKADMSVGMGKAHGKSIQSFPSWTRIRHHHIIIITRINKAWNVNVDIFAVVLKVNGIRHLEMPFCSMHTACFPWGSWDRGNHVHWLLTGKLVTLMIGLEVGGKYKKWNLLPWWPMSLGTRHELSLTYSNVLFCQYPVYVLTDYGIRCSNSTIYIKIYVFYSYALLFWFVCDTNMTTTDDCMFMGKSKFWWNIAGSHTRVVLNQLP